MDVFGDSRASALQRLRPVPRACACLPLGETDVVASVTRLAAARGEGLLVYGGVPGLDLGWLPQQDVIDGGAYDLSVFRRSGSVSTGELLRCLAGRLRRGITRSEKRWCDRLTQRFEVTKKIFPEYGPGLRRGRGSMEESGLYAALAIVLCLSYVASDNLKYLNALLKVNDTLISVASSHQADDGFRLVLSTTILCEGGFVREVCQGQGVPFGPF